MKTKKTDLLPKGVHVQHSKGKTYVYAWRGKGAPRIKATPGTNAFLAELAGARAGGGADKTKNVRWLIAKYKSHAVWTDEVGPETRAQYAPWLDRIGEHFGKMPIKDFDRPMAIIQIRKWRDKFRSTPTHADNGMTVLSRLMTFARREEGLLMNNPCTSIEKLGGIDRSEIIWEGKHMELAEANLNVAMMRMVRGASLTGMRESDLCRLAWTHIDETCIELGSNKSRVTRRGQRAEARRSYVVPMYPALREFLATIPRASPLVFLSPRGQPWKVASFSVMFSREKNKVADLEHLHFHDLRGTAATMFQQSGMEAEVIAEILAWEPERVKKIIKRYVARGALIRAQIERLADHQRTPQERKL